MNLIGYTVYALLAFVGVGLWVALFLAMRKGRGKGHDIVGLALIGPLHSYLRRRNYTLSGRELFGWAVVLLLMLAAPWITFFLER